MGCYRGMQVAAITLIVTLSVASGQHTIRLENGPTSTSGRVEILYNGVWHTVCDDNFNQQALRVVCRMIGIELDDRQGVYYPKAQLYGPGNGNNEYIFDNFQCSGTETSILDCSGINTNDNCANSEDIGVDCLPQSIRLVNGSSDTSGRVEILYSGLWHTVCDDNFNRQTLKVVCRMIGIELDDSQGVFYGSAKMYGRGSGNRILDRFQCSGTESSILSCSSITSQHDCSHGEDISVDCSGVRLVNGPTNTAGRLEVLYNSQWHTVCDDDFDRNALKVVCRMIGIDLGVRQGVFYGSAQMYGPGSGDNILDNFSCSGTESSILNCRGINSNDNCGNSEDVGIDCSALHLGSECQMDSSGAYDPCIDINSKCIESSCTCVAGFYDNNGNNVGGVCTPKLAVGTNCPIPTISIPATATCLDTFAKCTLSGNEYTCQCITGYYDDNGETTNNGVCRLKSALGDTCQSNISNSCSDLNAECIDGTCNCSSGYYDDNGSLSGGTCLTKVGLNSQCSKPDACGTENAECSYGTCVCSAGFYDDNGDTIDGSCVEKIDLGSVCPEPSVSVPASATCIDVNAECSSPSSSFVCKCSDGYFDSNGLIRGGICIRKVGLNSQCSQPDACGTSGAVCSSGACMCSAGFYDDNGDTVDGSCVEKVGLNSQCSQPDACGTDNAVYSSGTCMCSAGFFDDNGDTVDGSCVERVGLNSRCSQPDACGTANAECNSGICVCSAGFYGDNGGTRNGSCVERVGLNRPCPQADACVTPNAFCSSIDGSGTCACRSNYFDDNGDVVDGSCILRVDIGAKCSPYSNRKQCVDDKAECQDQRANNLSICSCIDGYHIEIFRGNQSCFADAPLGGRCSGDHGCSDIAAECLSGICTCSFSHYDDNGLDDKGICQPVSKLKVSAISFLSSMPGSLNVSWSLPEDFKQYINQILVHVEPQDNSSSAKSVSLAGFSTSMSISDLIPGQAYTIVVKSINTQTESGSNRLISLSKDQATKPETPGPINEVESDLDTENNTIYLVWNASVGYVSGYMVKVFDSETDVVITDQLVPTENVLVASPNLKHGHMYRIEIIAKSQIFLGETLPSDQYTDVIKTVVEVPGPPTGLKCVGSGLSNITLSWIAPSHPYGSIIQYHIHVYVVYDGSLFATVNTKTNRSTYTVNNLNSGTYYGFEIYTENENYNSSTGYSSDSNCRTSSKKSDPPSQLNVSAVQSRTLTVTWAEPNDTYSEENYGYIVQLENSNNKCLKEHIYKCDDCIWSIQVSALENLCGGTVQTIIDRRQFDLVGTQSFQASDLLPDTEYVVTVMAVNSEGLGEQAVVNITTNEEAPKTPTDVHVTDITSNTFIVTWNIDGPRPGKTYFTLIVTADPGAPSFSVMVTGFDHRRKMIENLEEYWNYTVSVNASTTVGSRHSEPTSKFTTKAAAPGSVTDLGIAPPGPDHRRFVISWKSPALLDRNGIIIGYMFQHNASEVEVLKSHTITEKPDSLVYKEEVTVIPEKTYNFEVWAVNHEGQNGSVIQKIVEVPPGVPINTVESADRPVILTSGVGPAQNTLRLAIYRPFLLQENNGKIRVTGLIGCEVSKCDGIKRDMTLVEFNSMDNWADVREKGFTPYRITNNIWIAKNNRSVQKRHLANDDIVYIVGSDQCDTDDVDGYCNGPLVQGTKYKFVAVTCTNGGCLLSKQYGPFATEKDEQNNIMTFIIGISGTVVALVTGVAVALIFYCRRRDNFAMSILDSERPEELITLDRQVPKHRPIILSNFNTELEKLHNDSNLNFSSEFADLNTVSPYHSQEAAERKENRMKNKYPNILPFDHSRVKLFTDGEEDKEDYINASYLPGYNSLREYIGCQGPIPGTTDDFWQLVWEQNASVIVMLTLCREGQKEMCEQYWPNELKEPKRFGNVIVELNSYSSIKTYDHRIFKLVFGDKTRVVKHFQFLSWLDFEASLQHEIMLDFITQVRTLIQPPDTCGPIVVHCSAGVGRTGTYIIMDHLLQLINSNDCAESSIDIFNMVLKLRENRPQMVQTEQQYMFIHDCVKLILERKKDTQ